MAECSDALRVANAIDKSLHRKNASSPRVVAALGTARAWLDGHALPRAGGARFVPTFCASAGRLSEPHATLDGVHADDRINWAKAQLVLGELCEA